MTACPMRQIFVCHMGNINKRSLLLGIPAGIISLHLSKMLPAAAKTIFDFSRCRCAHPLATRTYAATVNLARRRLLVPAPAQTLQGNGSHQPERMFS